VGEKRKEGSRDSTGRGAARSGAVGRGTPRNTRPRKSTGGERTGGGRERGGSGADVVRFPENRRARRGSGGAGRPERPSRTGGATREVGRRRLRLVVAAFLATALLLGGRAVQMSVANDGQYLAYAAESGGGAQVASENRGSIISADGRKLATSLKTARVVATPYLVREPAEAARALVGVIGPETGQGAAEIEAALTRRNPDGTLGGYSVVASGLEPGTAEKVEELGIEGISLSSDSERVYPEGELASQLLGHVGTYGEAFGGVEARYDGELKGGGDVNLTVDSAVQRELEEALQATVEENDARSALGLVMRSGDGAIVALANSPGYDNGDFSEAPLEAQRDRVLTDPYEPGSTFKAFTVAAALEEGAVTPESTFTVPDHIQVADRVIHDSQPHETEIMAPADVLRESSNVGAIQVAQALGGPKVEEYIRRFGFGEATGVDLWGEDPGMVPAYADWSGSSIGNIPIGQGLTVTPLQLVSGYATLANGGLGVKPHVAERGDSAAPGPRVISGATSAIVRGMLQGVVDEGSGHNAQIPGYTVAGKTGTSQVVDPETGTYGGGYVASFVGFAPASDPEYVALIAVDDPGTTYWGEVVAAPAFQDVMSFTLGYFNVPPDRTARGVPSGEAAG
jgi:cell division protein FtsI (penicillin-binding protein 3)